MGSAALLWLVSEKEFLRLPESTSKVELVDGEVVGLRRLFATKRS